MFWFRIAIIFSLLIDLVWALGLVAGILIMVMAGSASQSMVLDPALNSTMTSYVFILFFQFAIMLLCLFGFFVCFKVWRNKYQLDHDLRHIFVIWIGAWACCILGAMAIAVYALMKVKDPQGQMGFMYEMFTKYAIDIKFVSSFERYQKDHSCCGVYGPDDWLIVVLRATPGGGGMGGMFGGGNSFDYGFQQNPSSGKCHVIPPMIPSGCGPLIMKDVNMKLSLYAGLTIVQVALGIIAAVLAWYCFFYWLEKEVIVIPEDEVSNIIVIEPEDSSEALHTSTTKHTLFVSTTGRPLHYGSSYHHHHPKKENTYRYLNRSHSKGGSGHEPTASHLPLPPEVLNDDVTQKFLHSTSNPIPLHHNSFTHTSIGVMHGSSSKSGKTHEEKVLEKQLKTLGGKVLAKMKVDHNSDGDQAPGSSHPEEKKEHHATLAIVRNRHKNDPPPTPPPGKHGHTGHLADDIAFMTGGKKITNKIEDLIITEDGAKKAPKKPEPEVLGSITGLGVGFALNNLLMGKTESKKKEKPKDEPLIKPLVVTTKERLHGGSGIGHNLAEVHEKIEKAEKEREKMRGSSALHNNSIKHLKYLPISMHGKSLEVSSQSPYHDNHHEIPPATLDDLVVPSYASNRSQRFTFKGESRVGSLIPAYERISHLGTIAPSSNNAHKQHTIVIQAHNHSNLSPSLIKDYGSLIHTHERNLGSLIPALDHHHNNHSSLIYHNHSSLVDNKYGSLIPSSDEQRHHNHHESLIPHNERKYGSLIPAHEQHHHKHQESLIGNHEHNYGSLIPAHEHEHHQHGHNSLIGYGSLVNTHDHHHEHHNVAHAHENSPHQHGSTIPSINESYRFGNSSLTRAGEQSPQKDDKKSNNSPHHHEMSSRRNERRGYHETSREFSEEGYRSYANNHQSREGRPRRLDQIDELSQSRENINPSNYGPSSYSRMRQMKVKKPLNFLDDEDDGSFDYNPYDDPRPHPSSYDRNNRRVRSPQSSYSNTRRKEKERAEVLFKNPRRIDESD